MSDLVEELKKGLQSMKLKKNKPEKMDIEPEPMEYPYCLRIDLGSEQLEALGLKADDFKAGDEVMLLAEASVEQISSRVEKSKLHSNISLQIRKLSLKGDE